MDDEELLELVELETREMPWPQTYSLPQQYTWRFMGLSNYL